MPVACESNERGILMYRAVQFIVTVLAAVTLTANIGCATKITTVQQHESVHESQPKMVSPGTEVVE